MQPEAGICDPRCLRQPGSMARLSSIRLSTLAAGEFIEQWVFPYRCDVAKTTTVWDGSKVEKRRPKRSIEFGPRMARMTEEDPTWTSLVFAPYHQEYLSAHSIATSRFMRCLNMFSVTTIPTTSKPPPDPFPPDFQSVWPTSSIGRNDPKTQFGPFNRSWSFRVLCISLLSSSPALGEGLNVLFAGTQEIQKIQPLIFAGLANT